MLGIIKTLIIATAKGLVLDLVKRKLKEWTCPHAPAFPANASSIIKQTKWDDDTGSVNRRALCTICGATWEHIPDWATFKPSPGRPRSKGGNGLSL
jgi:hypothetical protein